MPVGHCSGNPQNIVPSIAYLLDSQNSLGDCSWHPKMQAVMGNQNYDMKMFIFCLRQQRMKCKTIWRGVGGTAEIENTVRHECHVMGAVITGRA